MPQASFPALDEGTIRAQLTAESAAALQALSLLDATTSTNDVLLQLPTIERHGQAVLADQQSGGRGRQGRKWQSPAGSNIYLSLAWNFPRDCRDLSCLPLAIGIAAIQGLESCVLNEPRFQPGLKWPNDIQSGGKKLGGILLESRPDGSNGVSVVAGVGINVHMPQDSQAAQEIDQPWASVGELIEAAAEVDLRDRLAGAVLDRMLHCLGQYHSTGFDPFRMDWQRLDTLRGQMVLVTQSGKQISGKAMGIDIDGNLLLETVREGGASCLRSFSAGEVSVRPQ
jgi:BirA family biotin operon repressor/biotin-[acetyl-CoA-carboxylase] ligase